MLYSTSITTRLRPWLTYYRSLDSVVVDLLLINGLRLVNSDVMQLNVVTGQQSGYVYRMQLMKQKQKWSSTDTAKEHQTRLNASAVTVSETDAETYIFQRPSIAETYVFCHKWRFQVRICQDQLGEFCPANVAVNSKTPFSLSHHTVHRH